MYLIFIAFIFVYVTILPHAFDTSPDSKVHGANMGPIWGRQNPGGPHVRPMNLIYWGQDKMANI